MKKIKQVKKEEQAKEPITKTQIEKTALTVALADVSNFGEGVFIVAGDVKTDQLFAFYKGKFIPAQIKNHDGEKMDLVKKVLDYSNDENAVNSFLHFIDGLIFAFSGRLKEELKVEKNNKKSIKKPMKK
jgi:hypothetical protein